VKGFAALAAAHKRRVELETELGRQTGLQTLVAVDFLHGGCPAHARVFDRKGALVGSLDRLDGEDLSDFRQRAHGRAQETAGAIRAVVGGIGSIEGVGGAGGLPRGAVSLPDIPLHPSQREAVALIEAHRRVCLVCGRRWGKSALLIALAVDYALSGRKVGMFTPTYRFLRPLVDAIAYALAPLPGIEVNRGGPYVRLPNGGAVDFGSIDVTGRVARGKAFHLVLIDEAAHDEGYLKEALEASILPATLDYRGKIVLASTPAGLEGGFWECATIAEKGYAVHHAPSSTNPHLSADEIAYLRSTLRAEVASQELDALFVDVAGSTIFPIGLLLESGEPWPDEGWVCDYVGVCIDSNSGKGGPDRDGCAAVVFGVTLPGIRRGVPESALEGARVILLDWDIVSLAQGGVAPWLQRVREMTMSWFFRLRPLGGLPQAWIEPAGNFASVIEIAQAQGLSPNELDSKFVAMGKDRRALGVEPHATAGRVKIGRYALDRRSSYRGIVANHLVRQVTGFKCFDKDSYKREDDLFDAAMYSVLAMIGDGTEAEWTRLKRTG
jgi:hypothetical protein